MATSAFGKAFRAARDAGDKTFTFNGKTYTTKMKEEMPDTERETQGKNIAFYKNALDAAKKSAASGEEREAIVRNLNKAQSDYAGNKAGQEMTTANYVSRKPTMPDDDSMGFTYAGKAPPTDEPKDMSMLGMPMKKGGKVKHHHVKKMASGGHVSSASKRADGIAMKGRTKGRIC